MKKYQIIKKLASYNYDNKFSVVKTLVKMPDGREGIFHLREVADYSIIVPVLDDENIIMIRQPRLGADKISLEFPMGIIAGKNPLEVAVGELKQETGYSAEKFSQIASFYLSPGWSNQKAFVFIAENLIQGEQEPEPYEFIEVEKIGKTEIPGLIKKGMIFDASTITSWYYYSEVRGNNALNMR